MATGSTQAQSRSSERKVGSTGLTAYGRSGSWEVAVDETLTDPEKWYMQMEGPSFDLYIQIQHPQAIESMFGFLNSHQAVQQTGEHVRFCEENDTIEVGCLDDTPVRFVWHQEGYARLRIAISKGECSTNLTVPASDVPRVLEALRMVRDSLADDELLVKAS